MAPLGALTQAWVAAEAATPLGWELRGLMLGPRVADPAFDGPDWVARARAKDSKDAALPPAKAAVSCRSRRSAAWLGGCELWK